jgi:hypothetical protein
VDLWQQIIVWDCHQRVCGIVDQARRMSARCRRISRLVELML